MTTLEATHRGIQSLLQRQGVQQFIKFAIVGASSTLITGGVYSGLIYAAHLEQLLHAWLAPWTSLQQFSDTYAVYLQLAMLAGFVFGVTNGFVWNSRWTFRE